MMGDRIVPFDDFGPVVKGLKISSGQPVDILRKTRKNYSQQNPTYHWTKFPYVEIQYGENRVWVSGKFVFKFDESNPTRSIEMDKNKINLFLGKNFGVGATNEDGLTEHTFDPVILGNSSDKGNYYLIPFFTKDTVMGGPDKYYYFVSNKDTLFVPWNGFYALENDGGAGEKIAKVEVKKEKIIFHISAEYMEGSATYELVIPYKGKPFNATLKHYLRKWD
jgi:hypothetical protein